MRVGAGLRVGVTVRVGTRAAQQEQEDALRAAVDGRGGRREAGQAEDALVQVQRVGVYEERREESVHLAPPHLVWAPAHHVWAQHTTVRAAVR